MMDLPNGAQRALGWLDTAIWILFGLEFLWRLYLVREKRLRYAAEHPIDVLVVALPFARPLRGIRSLRVLRSSRTLRAIRAGRVGLAVGKGSKSTRQVLTQTQRDYALVTAILVVFACAALAYELEKDAANGLRSFGDALWWSVTTALSGSSAYQPVTAEARVITVLLMLLGVSVVAALAGVFAAKLTGRTTTSDRQANYHEASTQDLRSAAEEIRTELAVRASERNELSDPRTLAR